MLPCMRTSACTHLFSGLKNKLEGTPLDLLCFTIKRCTHKVALSAHQNLFT